MLKACLEGGGDPVGLQPRLKCRRPTDSYHHDQKAKSKPTGARIIRFFQ